MAREFVGPMYVRSRTVLVKPSTPYALTAIGLVVGLVVWLFEPFTTARTNAVVGAAFLVLAFASVTYMIVEHSGPGKRGPDF